MYISRLSLQNYRNYRRLDLDLSPGVLLFYGENAQGKSNLLEAIYLLATVRSDRAGTESELIGWPAADEQAPVARLVATVIRGSDRVEVEVAIVGRRDPGEAGALLASKRLKVNGLPRRASEVVGQINAVLFTSQDIDLISGPPALRRRHLDIAISQADSHYLRALQRYGKALLQRNHLLKRLQEGSAREDELEFWDGELVKEGTLIFHERWETLKGLSLSAREAHGSLTAEKEELGLQYRPQLEGWDGAWESEASPESLAAQFATALARGRRREIAAGATLQGPHRDDVLFAINGVSAAAYASRAQQRTAALALRLAEAHFLRARTGEAPVLLLDDVLSELDEKRRHRVVAAIQGAQQVLVTAVEKESLRASFGGGFLYRVEQGAATPEGVNSA